MATLQAECHAALAVLERVLRLPPEQVPEDLPGALRALVKVRNRLIEQRRNGGSAKHLAQVNAILSIVTSAEYPLVGVRMERVKQARDALRDLAPELCD